MWNWKKNNDGLTEPNNYQQIIMQNYFLNGKYVAFLLRKFNKCLKPEGRAFVFLKAGNWSSWMTRLMNIKRFFYEHICQIFSDIHGSLAAN